MIFSDVNPDEERFEKKRVCAILYQQYKNRSGPPNPGSKKIPKVCLHNFTDIF